MSIPQEVYILSDSEDEYDDERICGDHFNPYNPCGFIVDDYGDTIYCCVMSDDSINDEIEFENPVNNLVISDLYEIENRNRICEGTFKVGCRNEAYARCRAINNRKKEHHFYICESCYCRYRFKHRYPRLS
jgi:hypothetical protein